MAIKRSTIGIPVVSSPRAARKPAGIITISLGNGMKELSTAIKKRMKIKPHTGANAAIESR
jgi:hypothetical protein